MLPAKHEPIVKTWLDIYQWIDILEFRKDVIADHLLYVAKLLLRAWAACQVGYV